MLCARSKLKNSQIVRCIHQRYLPSQPKTAYDQSTDWSNPFPIKTVQKEASVNQLFFLAMVDDNLPQPRHRGVVAGSTRTPYGLGEQITPVEQSVTRLPFAIRNHRTLSRGRGRLRWLSCLHELEPAPCSQGLVDVALMGMHAKLIPVTYRTPSTSHGSRASAWHNQTSHKYRQPA